MFVAIAVLWMILRAPSYARGNHSESPLYPGKYSEAEKEQQRLAGSRIVNAINQAAKAGDKEFTVPAGVYRIPEGGQVIDLYKISNGFRLNVSDVEFVKEDHTPLFRLIDSRNLEIVGPVILDCDPLPYIQGVVHDYDHENGRVTMQVADGFPLEVEEKVVKVFSPDGQWLKNPQWNTCRDYEIVAPEKRLVAFTPKTAKDGTEEIFIKGNQLVIGYGNYMFSCRRVEGIALTDVDCYHGGGVMWGQDCGGNWKLRGVRSVPRPETRRLTGGHAFQVTFRKAALTMEECEFASNT
jgi:hypothetical protein